MFSSTLRAMNGEMNNRGKYSQVRAMLAIARASLISITRSPSAVVFSLLFPMIFILVFGFIGGRTISVDVAVQKQCNRNNPVYFALETIGVIKLDTLLTESAIDEGLAKGEVDAALLIRDNGGNSVPRYTVHVTTVNTSREKANVLKSILNNVFYKLNIRDAHIIPSVAELEENEMQIREYKTIDFILPGQLGFSLLSSGVFGTAFVFLSLRQTLVIKRFFATPVHRTYIVLGEALSRLVFSISGALLIILIGHFAFGFTLLHGFLTVINMLVLATLGLVIFMGFGFAVSGLAKNESSIPPIANIITMPQFLLSGTFFSISLFPGWLQPVCKVLPLTYLNEALRKIAFEGASLWSVNHEIGILFLWGILVYALAVKFFRWE